MPIKTWFARIWTFCAREPVDSGSDGLLLGSAASRSILNRTPGLGLLVPQVAQRG